MNKIIILSSFLIAGNFFAQKNKIQLSNNSKISNQAISKNGQKSKSSEDVKKDLIKSQKILKIEIINEGDWEELNQISWFRFVKVNDGKFEQILNTENSGLELVSNSNQTNNWKDENGNVSFRSISEPLNISQEFTSAKNEKGELKSSMPENEIFETTSPVSSFSFLIYTSRKDNNPTIKTELSKTINIYADGKLIKSLIYTYADLSKIGGISLKNFQVGEVE
ncbi:hypothetical protein [Kaistella yonginensis]|uniref:hypothetical protein n=1 Tax=Kaistella yonginensis TaxID=658267 RepID=UPI0025B5CF0E|nr:hypothetical protein [Kaistella yonginensis]MDN3607710.1 hypothetical protein [Kaistella yonginensis]